jgi:hypothetical protein
MTEHNQAGDAERLTEESARRVLQRAGELEAARGSELSVAELREAAREAGIAPGAFEQALTEFRRTAPSSVEVATPEVRRRLSRFWPAAVVIAVVLTYVVLRLLIPIS